MEMENRDQNQIPQAAPAARTAALEKEARRVKRTFASADEHQAERFARARTVVAALEKETVLRADAWDIGELGRAKKNVRLDPFTIATIGQSGRGKSTLQASLLGRRDIHPNASGKPLTACITRTFMDIDPDSGEAEYAVLQLRTESEIRALVERQVKNLGIDSLRVPTDLEDLPAAISAHGIEATPPLEALLEVIQQFTRNEDLITGSAEDRRIPLDSPSGLQRLHDIVREDSAENQNPEDRIVDIVKSVDIHLYRPVREDHTHLQLQLSDTCLVDTPGTGGTQFHRWGLEELIADGNLDVVLFCVNPRRVTETEFELARSLNTAIRAGHLHPQQLLLIHNAIDEEIEHTETETAIFELMRVLGGGPEMFEVYETSALSAIWALEALNAKPGPNTEKYQSMAVALGLDPEEVKNMDAPKLHKAVYANSGLPELIQAINEVTRAHTVEARVQAAETSVASTVTRLANHYKAEDLRLVERLNKHGNADFEAVQLLSEKEKAAHAYIGDKRASLLEHEPETLQALITETSEDLYTRLDLPKLWDDNFVLDRLRTLPTSSIQRPLPRTFISDTEEWVWRELDLKPIGAYFASRLETAFGESACQELLKFGLDTPEAAEVISVETAREITGTAGRAIIDFADNVGKAMLGKPNYRLISDFSTDTEVLQILETIVNTPDRKAEETHFQALLNAIRTCYEPGIQEAVDTIRGFYEATLAEIEKSFAELVFTTFITLKDNRNNSKLVATLFEEIDEERKMLHLQKQTLDAKRDRLKAIETLMTTLLDANAAAG